MRRRLARLRGVELVEFLKEGSGLRIIKIKIKIKKKRRRRIRRND